MAIDVDRSRDPEPQLDSDFALRLEQSLPRADHERRRRAWFGRLRAAAPVVLLIGPVIAWRLMLSSPDAVHIGINSLAWLASILDIGVHVDSVVLSYLGLKVLPSLVGILLFILVSITLLGDGKGDR